MHFYYYVQYSELYQSKTHLEQFLQNINSTMFYAESIQLLCKSFFSKNNIRQKSANIVFDLRTSVKFIFCDFRNY